MPGEIICGHGGVLEDSLPTLHAAAELSIALNAPQSQHTLSSRFLSKYFGSGVQHIAFGTDDVLATVKSLQANGGLFWNA